MRIFEKCRIAFPEVACGPSAYCINVNHESGDKGVRFLEGHLRRDLDDRNVFPILDLESELEASFGELMPWP